MQQRELHSRFGTGHPAVFSRANVHSLTTSALRYLTIILFILLSADDAFAQEINFGQFGSYTITIENITLGDLTFESPILSGGGVYQVELIDSYVLSIIGVRFLDVGVDLIADGELLLDGNPANSGDPQRSIPFTLRAAYANFGQNNISDAVFIPISGTNVGSARFPVFGRRSGPPGPPPAPPTGQFDQSLVEETAYLYLYGDIDVGNVLAGFYSGNITVTVEYL